MDMSGDILNVAMEQDGYNQMDRKIEKLYSSAKDGSKDVFVD